MVDEEGEGFEESRATSSTADEAGPSDPLEEAIAKMRAMGFDDDSGWLSQLIKAKGYDISRVLDAMHFEGKN